MTERTWMHDALILALIDRIPAPGSVWPQVDREKWLQAVAAALNLAYRSDDNIPETKLTVGDDMFVAIVDNGDHTAREISLTAAEVIRLREGGPGPERPTQYSPEQKMPALQPVKRKGQTSRPSHVPNNITLALEAIDHHGGRASSIQITDYVRQKHWPDVSIEWKNCLWTFASEGRLARDGINFIRPGTTPKLPPPPPVDKKEEQRLADIKSTVTARKASRAASTTMTFAHNDKSVELPSSGYVFAAKLKAAMGKHISDAFLAERVVGSNTELHRDRVRQTCLSMNDALAEVGLTIEHYPGFGLIMKEVDVA